MSSNYFGATTPVPLLDIVIRPAWQVRTKLSAVTVDRYAAIYKAGSTMDPVRLARINGGLVLVDGAHRLEALRGLGRPTVEAVITTMAERAAEWAAASANLGHGQPLKKSELRGVFQHYIATKQHCVGRSRVKSLRDIAKDIPGTTHGTIRNWLKKDYPALYRKSYAGSGASGHSHGGLDATPRPTQRQLDLAAAEAHIQQVAALVALLSNPRDRQQVARCWTATLGPVL